MYNIKVLFVIFALLAILAIPLRAETIKLADCQENGYCIISAEMLTKVVRALEHWHEQAKTCRGA